MVLHSPRPAPRFRNIYDAALSHATLRTPGSDALRRMFHITAGTAGAVVAEQLAARYSVGEEQMVVSVTNRFTLEQVWFNEARTRKPQTFKQQARPSDLDPTGAGGCDFCAWPESTAADSGFGRIELRHAVTGSNLFKCCEPGHGIVLFKSHDPLEFDQHQLSDLLDASWLWMVASAAAHATDGDPSSHHPFFLWNCLPRAGASQFHGHAQVLLSRVPLPQQQRLWQAAAQHEHQTLQRTAAPHGLSGTGGDARQLGGSTPDDLAASLAAAGLPSYYCDLLAAHDALGLLRSYAAAAPDAAAPPTADDGGLASAAAPPRAWAVAHLAPVKDAEVLVVGSHLGCPAFKHLLYCVLRALIDRLGIHTFNVGALNLDVCAPPPATSSVWGSAEAAGVAAHLRPHGLINEGGSGAGSAPIVARLVGRGKLGSMASDYGCLEVFGGASIGHTDPFQVIRAVDEQLAGAGGVAVN